MWETEASSETQATTQKVWQLWTDVANWKNWDAGIEWSSIEGPFAVGSQIRMRQKDGPELHSELVEVQAEKGFRDRTRLPEATTLDFIHEVTRTSTGARVTHRIVLTGPAAAQFAEQIGAGLKHGLEEALHKLTQLAGGI